MENFGHFSNLEELDGTTAFEAFPSNLSTIQKDANKGPGSLSQQQGEALGPTGLQQPNPDKKEVPTFFLKLTD